MKKRKSFSALAADRNPFLFVLGYSEGKQTCGFASLLLFESLSAIKSYCLLLLFAKMTTFTHRLYLFITKIKVTGKG